MTPRPTAAAATGRPAPVPTLRGRRLIGAAVAIALAAMVLALWWGAGRPGPSPDGLPDAGPITGWLLPAVRVVTDLAGALTVGCLVLAGFLLPTSGETLTGTGLRAMRGASWAAATWAVAALGLLLLTASDVIGTPLSSLTNSVYLQSFLRDVSLGRSLLIVVVLAAIVAGVARFVESPAASAGLLLVALVAWLPPALSGHSAASDQHGLAVVSLAVHVLSMALWCGGLAAVVLVAGADRGALPLVLRRFGVLAVWCVVALLLSGLANAAVRLDSPSQLLTTSYGRILLTKAAVLAVLVVFGLRQRRRRPAPDDAESGQRLLRAAAAEVLVMAAAIGLAVALSRTPPPVPSAVDLTAATPARLLLGFDLPPVPTLARLVWGEARVEAFFLVVSVLLAALYVTGLLTLRRRGDSWPSGRTFSWLTALVLLVVVTSSGLGTYAGVLFSAHMLQHMVLNMIIPIFLVLGAPITLALRTLPAGGGPRAWLLVFVHSRPVAVLSHPLVAAAIFIGSFYVLYFSELFPILMRSHWGHVLMTVHFLLAGSLFFWVLIGIDPGPRRPPYVFRVLLLLVAMPLHAFFSIAVMSSTSVLGGEFFAGLQRPYAVDLLADQRLGGGIGWAMGELPIAIVLAVLFVQWIRSDEQLARRFDRQADRAEQGDERAVDELADYNAYLAALAERDRGGSQRVNKNPSSS